MAYRSFTRSLATRSFSKPMNRSFYQGKTRVFRSSQQIMQFKEKRISIPVCMGLETIIITI